jgi:uncharacterized protein YkwD
MLLALSLMSVPSVRAVGAGDTSGAEAELEFLSLLNQSRAAARLPALSPDDGLATFARWHTREMIGRGELFHSATDVRRAVVPPGWQRLGENVGAGATAGTLHEAFMTSPHHRDNILGDYTAVAIGADRDREGRLYVTVVFVKRRDPAPVRWAQASATGVAPPLSAAAAHGARAPLSHGPGLPGPGN